jgi:hypothetical protein
MFFVSNLQSYSQAGRRRFESGLPLHEIISFQQLPAHLLLYEISVTTEDYKGAVIDSHI